MVIELIQARGIRAWLNGQQPITGWQFDSDGKGNMDITSLQFPDAQPITKISLDKPLVDIVLNDPQSEPTIVDVQFADSNKMTLKVSQVVIGDYRMEEPLKVKLVNGQIIDIDEVSVYVKAQL